jgi:hypothetical protein
MKFQSRTITQNLIQFFLIVFSVVLGLYLSERIEEGKNRRASQELLEFIKTEVKDNGQLLQEWVPYHVEIQRRLDSLVKEPPFVEAFIQDRSVFFQELITKGTFMGRLPTNHAWDIAKSNPLIVNIDYDKMLALSRIYNQQEFTFVPFFDMFDALNSSAVNESTVAARNLEAIANHMRELVGREQQLLYYYREADSVLELNYKEDKNSKREISN